MFDPIISIIVPVYNAGHYLKECINSIVCESKDIPLEVILIDDGSRDCSGIICDSFNDSFAFVCVIHQNNGGVSRARNEGLNKARGKYVLFADADDSFINKGIQKLLTFAESNSLDFAFSDIEKVDFNGDRIDSFFYSEDFVTQKINKLLYGYLCDPRRMNLISFVWNKLFLKSIIDRNSLRFREDLPVNEDALFVFQFLSIAEKMGYLRENTYTYYTNRDNIGTGKMLKSPVAFAPSLEIIYRRLCSDETYNKGKLDRKYYHSYAVLGIRNLFHIIRCGKITEIYESVSEVVYDGQMQIAIRFYKDTNTENLRIIPFFIILKRPMLVILAFKLQLLLRQIKGLWRRDERKHTKGH